MSGKRQVHVGQPERAIIGRMIGDGHGHVAAAKAAGLSYRTFRRRLAEDADLAAEVREARQLAGDRLMLNLYQIATQNIDARVRVKAQAVWFARVDRLDAARRARGDRAALAKTTEGTRSVLAADLIGRLVGLMADLIPEDRHEEMLRRLDAVAEDPAADAPQESV